MTAAERYGELVADFQAHGLWAEQTADDADRRLTSADETGLRGDKLQMGFVAQPFGFGNGQNALIDPGREQVWADGTSEELTMAGFAG